MPRRPDEDELLRDAASRLTPVLAPLGFRFEMDQAGSSSGGPFASGFFENTTVKIGLIYRRGRFGAVVYEDANSNMSHDDIMRLTGNAERQRLRYEEASMCSIDARGADEIEALTADLQVLRPVLTDRRRMAAMIEESLRRRISTWGMSPNQSVRRWWQFWK
jgi:hypothetical protein